MPTAFESEDRKLLIGAGVLMLVLVALAAALGPAQVTGSAAVPSSYSPAWGGAKAAYLLLEKLGYPVERWTKPAKDLTGDGSGKLLVLADPTTAPNGEDEAAIHRFLETGGRVLATGPTAALFLPSAAPFTGGYAWQGTKPFGPLVPSRLGRGVREIELVGPEKWEPKSVNQVPIYGDAQTAAVVSWPVGKGEVIWWAEATPLTNGGIRRKDNLAFFLDSVGEPGTRVLWDEYYHGVRASLWSYFAETPAPCALAQFGLIFLALLFTYSRRQAPARAPAEVSRLAPLEFVDTLGDLYYSAKAAPAAVSIALGRLRFLLARQLGLGSNASAREISHAAGGRMGWDEAGLADLFARAERASRSIGLAHADALALVREIHDWITRLEAGSAKGRKAAR